MSLNGAEKIGILLRAAKDGHFALRAQTASNKTTFTSSGYPDMATWQYQMSAWPTRLNQGDYEENALTQQWVAWATKERDRHTSAISSWQRETTKALEGRIKTILDNPTLTNHAQVLSYLGRRMAEETSAVKACTVTVVPPTADTNNYGTPRITIGKQREGFEYNSTMVDNEAINSNAITITRGSATTLIVGLRCSDPWQDLTGKSAGDRTVNIIQPTAGDAQQTSTGGNLLTDSSFEGSTTSGALLASGAGGLSCTSSAVGTSSAQARRTKELSLLIPSGTTMSATFLLGTASDVASLGCTLSYLIPASTIRANTIYTFTGWAYASGLSSGYIQALLRSSTASQLLANWSANTSTTFAVRETTFRLPADFDERDGRIIILSSAPNVDVYLDDWALFQPATHGGMTWSITRGTTDPVPGDIWEDGSSTNGNEGEIQRWLRESYGTSLPSTTSGTTNFAD